MLGFVAFAFGVALLLTVIARFAGMTVRRAISGTVTLAGSVDLSSVPSSSIVLRMVIKTTVWFFGRIIEIERSVLLKSG